MQVGLLLSIVATCVIGYLISQKPDREDDKVDLVSKLCGSIGCCGLGKLLKSKKKGKSSANDSESDVESSDALRKIDNGTYNDGTERTVTEQEAPAGEDSADGTGVRDSSPPRLQMQSSSLRDASDADVSNPGVHRAGPVGGPSFRSGDGADSSGGPEVAPYRQGTL